MGFPRIITITIVALASLNNVKMSSGSGIGSIHKYIEDNQGAFVENLREAVGIPSVSSWASHRPHCIQMANWTEGKLKNLGFKVEVIHPGTQEMEGETVQLPPILFGTLGSDPKKKTLLIYGHLDVQPAKLDDGWDSEPFKLTERNGNLYGRGATDDKAPILGWLHCVEAFQKSGVDLPVNLKVVFEVMEEFGSVGLEETLVKAKDTFLKDVDVVTISDNYWLGTDKPCLTYGLRGLAYFFVEVEGGTKDLHSGIFGGTIREAMDNLLTILGTLKDSAGNILIPGLEEGMIFPDEKEKEQLANIKFDLDAYKQGAGCKGLMYPNSSKDTLEARWIRPSLTIHGIQGAFSDQGAKTVIPGKVIGKFSIRLVPNQLPEKIAIPVKSYLEGKWKELGSPNTFKVEMVHSGLPWLADYNHPNYLAAATATEAVYGEKPILTREGASIPITLTLQRLTGKNVLLLPMGQGDDGAHSQNEKMSKRNFIFGTKLFASYLMELGLATF